MYKIAYDPGSPDGDLYCEIIYKTKKGKVTVLTEKFNGGTASNVRFEFYKILVKISRVFLYIRKGCTKFGRLCN
jgi:hypothetical protein